MTGLLVAQLIGFVVLSAALLRWAYHGL